MQTIKAIKIDSTNSVLLEISQTNKETFTLWFDLMDLNNNEITEDTQIIEYSGDWNKYIFIESSSVDMQIKTFQESSDNFEDCLNIATNYYLLNNCL